MKQEKDSKYETYNRKPISFSLTPKSPTDGSTSIYKDPKIIPTERVVDIKDELYQRRQPHGSSIKYCEDNFDNNDDWDIPSKDKLDANRDSVFDRLGSKTVKKEFDNLKITLPSKPAQFDVLKSPPLSQDDIQGLLGENVDTSLDSKDMDELKTMRERIVSLVEKESKSKDKNKKSSKNERDKYSDTIRLAYKYPRHKKVDATKDNGYDTSPMYPEPVLSPPPSMYGTRVIESENSGCYREKN